MSTHLLQTELEVTACGSIGGKNLKLKNLNTKTLNNINVSA